nr:uncharacterized protein LOC129276529 [Lytechinus pictus]
MALTTSLSTVFTMLSCVLSLVSSTSGQMCTGDEFTLLLSSENICEGGNFTVQCEGKTGDVEVYRNGEALYNGTTLAPELQTREVSVTRSSQNSTCQSVILSFEAATIEDTGNYSCRTNATESRVRRLVVDSKVSQHDCRISAATGPVVEKGENISCSSSSGQPSWVNDDPATVTVNTGSDSVIALAFHSVSSILLTTLQCTVVSSSSSCPSVSTSCFDRVLVVPNPVDSYISLTPLQETINPGGSATYSCATTLSGARLAVAPTASAEAIQHTLLRFSDTYIKIVFSNITMNYTEPIVQCMLQYNERLVTSMYASAIVVEVDGATTTELPATSSHVSTVAITNSTESSVTKSSVTPMVYQSTTECPATTGNSFRSPTMTTSMVNVRTFRIIDTRYLIIGLVIGLLLFVAIVVLCALMFRKHARRRKGDWTISSASSRRGQAEVASSGIEGRLEWETDVNPLVVFETTAIDPVVSDDDNGSLTREDIEDSRIRRSNGYSKHVNEETPQVLRFNAVIENHALRETGRSSPPVSRENGYVINEGFSPGDQSITIHSGNIPNDLHIKPHQDLNTQQTIPNGHVIFEHSDVDEPVNADLDKEMDVASLNFIDATRPDASESDKDWDSGFSLGHDSILSEIDDDAINIISV